MPSTSKEPDFQGPSVSGSQRDQHVGSNRGGGSGSSHSTPIDDDHLGQSNSLGSGSNVETEELASVHDDSGDHQAEAQQSKDDQPEQDPNEVTWDGPDDPANPQNWSRKKKWWLTIVVSILTINV